MATPHPLSGAELFSVKGRVAVVTGAWTGIGLMIAQALAANGAKVYITGRRLELLEKSAKIHGSPERLGNSGGSMVPLVMDVTDKESIKAAVDAITAKESKVDILVNNAGIYTVPPGVKPEDGPEKYSAGLFSESIEDIWQKSKSPHLPQPVYASAFGQFAYAASKAGTLHLTRQMAYELFQDGLNIRVNAIAPGPTPTALTSQGNVDEENQGIVSDEIFAYIQNVCGLTTKRWNTPQEISSASLRSNLEKHRVQAVLTLATNGHIVGQVIPIDGGELVKHPGVL
ncbi:hypothetical protein SLS62_008361 [Diatrype stigma]|uniref:NAD(P)-binding protein n=1 Tax=Diatrype stigma TaxID=117547 RepID=A0AAN9YP21_9PEZI